MKRTPCVINSLRNQCNKIISKVKALNKHKKKNVVDDDDVGGKKKLHRVKDERRRKKKCNDELKCVGMFRKCF